MIKIRKSNDRGQGEFGWLSAKYSFSFGSYFDSEHMGFRKLRVINEDIIEPGKGFGTHSHQNMEIITYIVEGAIAHKDSTGTEEVIGAGEIQRMTAGRGIHHSEFNALDDQKTHLLQIWIEPEETGLDPGYEQLSYTQKLESTILALVVAKDGPEGVAHIHQDVKLYVGRFAVGDTENLKFNPQRHAWIQVIKGDLDVNGEVLNSGDGAAISQVENITISASSKAEFLLFDLP